MKNGLLPAPAPTVTAPIRERSEQVPAPAAPAGHSGTLAIRPVNPVGPLTVSDLSSWSRSPRATRTRNDELRPALLLAVAASRCGAKRAGHAWPFSSWPTAKLLSVWTVFPLHDVNSACVV